MNTLEILKAGRELISDPARWTQATSARTADGEPCNSFSKRAASFCSLTAVDHAAGDSSDGSHCAAVKALQIAARGSIVEFNDRHTHAEVLAAWDRAIAKLEAA